MEVNELRTTIQCSADAKNAVQCFSGCVHDTERAKRQLGGPELE